MAEAQAGQPNAQPDDTQQQDAEDQGAPDDQQDEKQEQRPPASKTYTQEEVDRILGKVRKNARYLGRKEAEAELLRQGVNPRQAAAAVDKPAATEDPEPERKNFEDYEKYLDARAEWKGRKGQRDESAKEKREQAEQAEQDRAKGAAREFKKRAEVVMKELPDFAEVIENAEEVMITPTMGLELEESPFGPRILYMLAKDPGEAQRIAELPRNAQIREIGKLEVRAEADAKKLAPKDEKDDAEDSEQEDAGDDEDKQGDDAEDKGKDAERRADGTFKSQKKRPAPDPIEPGGGRRADTASRPSDKDDIRDWMRKRDAEESRTRRR